MSVQFMINPPKSIREVIYKGLQSFNARHLPEGEVYSIACFEQDAQFNVLGGLIGEVFKTTLFVEYLWVDETHRASGLGRALMSEMEHQVRKLGVCDLCLDTYTFQAREFYIRMGFEEVGRYSDFPAQGIDKIFMQKRLSHP
ncbi:GNAT family N-acetyltransferase [Vibrio sp. AK197]|uniref:GNAT family N-acetyltransferase n=1 Tax=Vibrio olivae TaxID=1243002 RepID=A0ABV5HMF3_9VIBR